MTTLQQAARDASDHGAGLFSGGFSWGTFLLVLGMFVALAVVSSLGFLARMRDRSEERRRPAPGTPTPPPGNRSTPAS